MSDRLGLAACPVGGVSVEEKRAWKAGRRALRTYHGYKRTLRREEMRLPSLLSGLSEIDAAILRDELNRTLVEPGSPDLTAAALAYTILSTGRPLAHVSDLQVTIINSQAPIHSCPPGMVIKGGIKGWWLEAGGPDAAQHRNVLQDLQHGEWSPSVWLPVGRAAWEAIRLELRRRGIDLGRDGSHPLFEDPAHVLGEAVRTLLKSIRRRAKVQVSMVRLSALLHNAVFHDSGDAALARLITGKEITADRSGSHYMSIPLATVARVYKTAASRIDAFHWDTPLPFALANLSAGSRYRPSNGAIREFADSQRAILEDRGRRKPGDICEIHNAMTFYTIAMVAFGTGFRTLRAALPLSRRIDPATGFMIVDDKQSNRTELPAEYKARPLWVCEAVREQIRFYETHLEALRRRLKSTETDFMGNAGALSHPVFVLEHDSGRYSIKLLNNADILDGLRNRRLYIRLNAGRHVLRSEMSGHCSGEIVRAFMGHWMEGAEPWVNDAALDPLEFRESLADILPEILKDLGFRPLAGLAK